MTEKTNYYLDITGELCPMTFVKTKLAIEKMRPGDTLDVRLRGREPLKNVPRSVRELGLNIIEMIAEPGEAADGVHRLTIRKT